MNKILRVLSFLWQLPEFVLVWLFYVLPMWALGGIKYAGQIEFLVWRFEVTDKIKWYWNAWNGWAGWSGPSVYLFKDAKFDFPKLPKSVTDGYNDKTFKHELRHVHQGFVFGPFNYILYLLSSLFIYFFILDKHPYLDNPFERDARAHSGDQVDIPRNQWPDGPNDRWPWW